MLKILLFLVQAFVRYGPISKICKIAKMKKMSGVLP
jgi:hypothetical protein